MSESLCPEIVPGNIAKVIIQLAGPRLVGIILVWGFLGVLSIQVYLYFQTFSKDRPALKALVCIVYLLQTAQTILLTESEWKSFITGLEDSVLSGFGGAFQDFSTVWSDWLSLYTIGGSLALLVQQFYVYRIYIISQNKVISGTVMLMSLGSFAGALTVAAFAKQSSFAPLPEVLASNRSMFTQIVIWLGLGSACDVAIVASMCYHLRRRAQGSPFGKTHALVSQIVRLTVETGALTASLTILVLVLFLFAEFSNVVFYFSAPLFVLASIYSTTMMAVLNSRIKLGIMSESSTWLDNELMSHKPDMSGIVFNTVAPTIASMDIGISLVPMEQSATSVNASEVGIKEQA